MVVMAASALPLIAYAPVAVAAEMAPNTDDEIVYLDPDRTIRVFDPLPPTPSLYVDWASPEGGWTQIALGDVTGDGDVEIIAVRQEEDAGLLRIFDPVAQDSPEDEVERINGVPWAILFELTLPEPPRLLATGEFDTGRRGSEILYSYALDDNTDRFVVLRQTESVGSGRAWEEQRSWDLGGRWNAVATGNVDDGIDEVALVSSDLGELAVFRIEPEVTKFFSNVNMENRWTSVAFGQFVLAGGEEVGAVRDADFPLGSTWVFRYDGSTMVDQLGERLSPSPNVVFFADVANNGDEELVLLRQVRQELGPRPRLILRDHGDNDFTGGREDLLDGDNAYKGGDAGDTDGDGRDEIVVVRDNRIRIYNDPVQSMTYQLIERDTDGQTVRLGNVDAAGLSHRPFLVASSIVISDVLAPGVESGLPQTVTVQDGGQGTEIPFEIIVQGAEDWVTVAQSDDVTPASLSITFNTAELQPGEYSGRVIVDAQPAGVENDPLAIDLQLHVESPITASPASVDFLYYRCEEAPASLERIVRVSSLGAQSFTTQIEGDPEWVNVTPAVGTLPEELVIDIEDGFRPKEDLSIDMVIAVNMADGLAVRHHVPIHLRCAEHRIVAPLIGK